MLFLMFMVGFGPMSVHDCADSSTAGTLAQIGKREFVLTDFATGLMLPVELRGMQGDEITLQHIGGTFAVCMGRK